MTMIFVYLFYQIFVIRKDKALKKMKTSKELKLLCQLGKIDIESMPLKELVKILAITNAFIIATMTTIVMLINDFIANFYLWIIVSALVGFVLLIPLILGVYKCVGLIIKKERRKDV